MNRVWTEEELEILRQDRAARIPIPVTAAKLGRPVPATYARARLIGTLVQPHQSWDEASVARLRELVLADPPMTDKCIAEELNRTVTQIRWKMQDLGLIGVRNLSKLAKITAAKTARPKPVKAPSKALPKQAPAKRHVARTAPADPQPVTAPAPVMTSALIDPRAALDRALMTLERVFAERLKSMIAASEAGMVEAAKAAIAEKGSIDQRLASLVRPSAPENLQRVTGSKTVEPETERKAEETVRSMKTERALPERSQTAARKPAGKKPIMPAAQGTSQAAPPRPVQQPAAPKLPKIIVKEAPAAVKPVEQDATPAQISGRGGWKSVRRDPARIMALAKAKAANRTDAVDLAQAAQAAIERFIAERGITRTETNGVQTIVSRLQARGYIVVRDGDGWVIDQRHRVANENELTAFAKARGITLSAAA